MTNFSIIRLPSNIIITIDKTKQIVCNNCDDKTFQRIVEAKNMEELATILPEVSEQFKEAAEAKELNNAINYSPNLIKKGQSVYWQGISELSMPMDLVKAVIKAEKEEDEDALEAYKNFWTLMSLNPDERCRQNLFWFLNIWGMQISKAGLFVGYRNVDILEWGENNIYSQSLCDFVKESYEKVKSQKQSPKHYWVEKTEEEDNYYLLNDKTQSFEEIKESGVVIYNLQDLYNEFEAVNFKAKNCGDVDTVYTDAHSHTFKIKIGELVSMSRKECDCSCDNECSRGLHLSRPGWLKDGYFGQQGLVCLCNPASVVSVPFRSNYGKLRTCEYLPIALCDYDEDREVIPYNVKNGFESRYIKEILYDGAKSTEEMPAYVINAPEIPEINKSAITDRIYEMAQKYINK